jgi:hypothetical protein
MRRFFENIKTIFTELVGVIGGFFWARSTKWDYEPLILLCISGACLLISLFLLFSKEKHITPLSSPNINGEIKELPNPVITDINPQNIKQKIENASLYQRNDIANNFVGLNVQWNLKLFTIHKRNNNKIYITMKPLDNTFPLISFETDIEQYPIFKIAEKDNKFIVTGKIIKSSEHDIVLKLISLRAI